MSHHRHLFSNIPPDEDAPERDLLRRCMKGDRAAFNQFVQQHLDNVFSYIAFIVNDPIRAAELTRRIFVTAFRQFPRYSDKNSVNAWLFGIAEHALQQETRARRPWYQRLLPLRFRDSADAGDSAAPNNAAGRPGDCDAIRDVFQEYLDGESNELDAKRVEKHLQRCPECWQEFEDLQDTVMLLQSVGRKHAPVELRPQINEAIEQITPSRNWAALFQSAPAWQLTSVVSIMIAMFSLAFSSLNFPGKSAEDDRRLRSGETTNQVAPPSRTFVMIAGSAQQLSDLSALTALLKEYHIPYDDKTVNTDFIPGDASDMFTEISERVRDMRGRILDTDVKNQDPFIQKIRAEIPNDPALAAFEELRSASAQPDASPSGAMRQLTFYLIELR